MAAGKEFFSSDEERILCENYWRLNGVPKFLAKLLPGRKTGVLHNHLKSKSFRILLKKITGKEPLGAQNSRDLLEHLSNFEKFKKEGNKRNWYKWKKTW